MDELNLNELEEVNTKPEDFYTLFVQGEFKEAIEAGKKILDSGLYNESTNDEIRKMINEAQAKLNEQTNEKQGFHL